MFWKVGLILNTTSQIYNIRVTSRAGIRSVLRELDSSTIVISIYDPNKKPELTNHDLQTIPHLCGLLSVPFWDELLDEHGCMTELQAREILSFVKTHLPWISNIVVHCEAGISRSAGVAAALAKILNGNDDFFFDYFHNRYVPNMTCYRRILEQYYLEDSK